ncbi:phenylalanine--tRNA ligase subunit beta, partial [Paraburkholderia sp. SIMBA_061]
LGEPVYPLLGLDDVVLDLTTTANRADALSMVGVAREVAALTGKNLRLPEVAPTEIPTEKTGLSVTITATEACPAYIGTEITNLTLAPSPQ